MSVGVGMGGVWGVAVLVLVGGCLQGGLARHYSSQWAAHIEGGPHTAQRIAQRHGFTFLGEIFPDCYHLQHSSVARRSINPSNEHHDNLLSEREVKWARQQKVVSRSKRDFTKSQSLFPLNDPKWTQMWYLNRGSGLDMSVQEAWNEGVTGRGVVVTILDDGLERDHPDLLKNYDPQASYDVNNHDDDPMPRYDLIDSNRHGTRCAGEVAAVANNSLCSVGIAFNANIGGVRMLDGDVTDAVEARSLSLNPQHIDIYSASWGPDDDGKTVDGPGELAVRAFMEGVTKGRAGKGSIFIWASGNGGRDHDNCNCDGYTNSIWTLSISSATEKGFVPWYSEACSSTLATTYSSGSNGEKQVITTDLHRMCTVSHSGTSASAPLAAGICALALEANAALTWRDMQHIVVATATPANLKAPDWTTNGVGRNVSHSFGYGLMDAAAMVKLARKWRTVPEQQKCEVIANHSDKLIPAKSSVTLTLNVKECTGVNYLEHVQAKISLNSQRRGDLQIHLTSPAGTKSTLLARRPHDVSRVGFQQWPFMSVHTWGESPLGLWYLEIHNEGRFLGQLQDWNMMFYGTESAPMSAELEPRPSTIKMAAKIPPTTKNPPETPTSKPPPPDNPPPGEVNEVSNSVRDKSISKDHGFEAINTSPSSADGLKCRRSTNICIGLCLILFLVQFLCNNQFKFPIKTENHCHKKRYKRVGRKEENFELTEVVEKGRIITIARKKQENFERENHRHKKGDNKDGRREIKEGEGIFELPTGVVQKERIITVGREKPGNFESTTREVQKETKATVGRKEENATMKVFERNCKTVKYDSNNRTPIIQHTTTDVSKNIVSNFVAAHEELTDVYSFQCRNNGTRYLAEYSSVANSQFRNTGTRNAGSSLNSSDYVSIQFGKSINNSKLKLINERDVSPIFKQTLEQDSNSFEDMIQTGDLDENSLKTRSKSGSIHGQVFVDYTNNNDKDFDGIGSCKQRISTNLELIEDFGRYRFAKCVGEYSLIDNVVSNSMLMNAYCEDSINYELEIKSDTKGGHENNNDFVNFGDSIFCYEKFSSTEHNTDNNYKPHHILLLIEFALLGEILRKFHTFYKLQVVESVDEQSKSSNELNEGHLSNTPFYSEGEFVKLVDRDQFSSFDERFTSLLVMDVFDTNNCSKSSLLETCSISTKVIENAKNCYMSSKLRYIIDQHCQINYDNFKHHNNFQKNLKSHNCKSWNFSPLISLKTCNFCRKNILTSQKPLKNSVSSLPIPKHFLIISL